MLFRRLSVFVGGCTLEGVEAVCNTERDLGLDVLDGMASLVDKSLSQQIEAAEGETRFVMLDTIREYGLERLAASGEETSDSPRPRRILSGACGREVHPGSAAQPSGSIVRGGARNFRAALEWLTQTGNAEWGLRLGAALFRFWECREHLTEGRDRLGKLLKLEGAAPEHTSGRVLFAAGVLAGEQGDYASAVPLSERAWRSLAS